MRAVIIHLCLALGCGVADADDRGRALFEPCRACHALGSDARGMAGPNLAGLIGRRVAGDPAFDYSPVLRKAATENAVWTADTLERFLADPERMFPGMWMTARPMGDAAERSALVRFLGDANAR